jgi:2,5-diketo-D-gluconate reductase B
MPEPLTQLPAIGLGTWQLEEGDCHDAVVAGLELGYRHVDTAQVYENEAAVGRALAAGGVPRDELWVTSKLWRDDMRAAEVRGSVERSLERLQLERLDLMLIHWPNDELPLAETLGALQECREAGLFRHLGVSNFPSALLREAAASGPLFNTQLEFHPYLHPRAVLAAAGELGISVTGYSPMAGGAVLQDAVLQEIAAAHQVDVAIVVLRWVLARGATSVLTRSTKPERLAAALAAPALQLTDAELRRIDGLHNGLRTCPAWFPLDWDEDPVVEQEG